jgi:hypothetical protein
MDGGKPQAYEVSAVFNREAQRGHLRETGYDDVNYVHETLPPYMAYSTVQGREQDLGVSMTRSYAPYY